MAGGLLGQLHRARNGVWVLIDVQTLVNSLRDGLDFDAQILLNVVEVEAVVPIDEVDGEAEMAVTTRPTDTMKVSFRILREIEVDNDIDSLYINAPSEEIRADEVAAGTIAEVVEHSVPGVLGHLGVAVKAGVAQLGDLLSQEFNTVGRVAENNRLVDLELGEKGVEAVDLGFLLDERVVLGDTTEGEFVHQVDLMRIFHVFVGEVLDSDWESSGEEH